MYEPFKSVVQCRVNFSQGDVRSQSCSLEPASGCHRWLRREEKLQRWGTVWNSLTDRVYFAFVSRCFSTMLSQERGEKLGNFKSSDHPTPSLKSTLNPCAFDVDNEEMLKNMNSTLYFKSKKDKEIDDIVPTIDTSDSIIHGRLCWTCFFSTQKHAYKRLMMCFPLSC